MNDVTLAHIIHHLGDCLTSIGDRLEAANRAETDAMDKAFVEIDDPTPPPVPKPDTSAADAFDTGAIESKVAAYVAPTTDTSTPPTLAPGVELDTNGFPWDARIHSGNRGKIKSGAWRYLKGGDKALIPIVEAELKAAAAATPAVPPVPTTDVPPVPPVPPTDAPTAPTPAATTTDAPTVTTEVNPYVALIRKIDAAKMKGKVTEEMVLSAVASIGIPAFPLLSIPQNQHLIPAFEQFLNLA